MFCAFCSVCEQLGVYTLCRVCHWVRLKLWVLSEDTYCYCTPASCKTHLQDENRGTEEGGPEEGQELLAKNNLNLSDLLPFFSQRELVCEYFTAAQARTRRHCNNDGNIAWRRGGGGVGGGRTCSVYCKPLMLEATLKSISLAHTSSLLSFSLSLSSHLSLCCHSPQSGRCLDNLCYCKLMFLSSSHVFQHSIKRKLLFVRKKCLALWPCLIKWFCNSAIMQGEISSQWYFSSKILGMKIFSLLFNIFYA